jgi:hypothetical protein
MFRNVIRIDRRAWLKFSSIACILGNAACKAFALAAAR